MPLLLCSGQHTTLLAGTPAETDLHGAESLDLPSDGQVFRWLWDAERALRRAYDRWPLSLVVVQGDTMTALAAARAARSAELPVAHVEAGIRSHHEEPWPEEAFRVEIDALASVHYAPTATAAENLAAEGIATSLVTGNTGVSAIARYSKATPVRESSPTIFVTMHRREFLASGGLPAFLEALAQAARDHPECQYVWPMHPGVLAQIRQPLPTGPNLRIVEPFPYAVCITGLPLCQGVMTDSGGLQEDAATLGVPCAVLRNVTDRPESIAAGVARLYPPTAQGLLDAATALANRSIRRQAVEVFGTPLAAQLVADDLVQRAA